MAQVCVCGFDTKPRSMEMFLKEGSIDAAPDDESFLASLRRSITNARGVYPPVAFAEIYCEAPRSQRKIRRLHLIVIDLDRTRNVGKDVYWQLQRVHVSARYEECFNTLPVPSAESNCPYRCKYVYGYAVDGSDRPSYLLWPRRGADGHFWLLDPMVGNYFDPYEADFLASIGVEHFFDAFALVHKRSIREAAAEALEIPLDDIQDNLVVKQSSARRFELTPISVPDDPPAKRAKTTKEPVSSARDSTMATGDSNANQDSPAESDSDSSDSNSDFSSEDGSSDVSDLDKFEEAYHEFGKLTPGDNTLALTRNTAGDKSDDVPGLPLVGGLKTLYTLANVPRTWPLARLTIPLSGFSKQLERLLEGYCMQIYATNALPDEQIMSIKLFAKDLVLLLAFHLAERIASLLRQVLEHPSKVLYDPENEVLFLPQFWLLPIYRELLNTASRDRPSRDSELRRAASGLVKVLCKPNDSAAGGKGTNKGQPLKQGGALARFNEWFGSMSLMNTLYVWFPASWGPSVVDAISKRNQTWLKQHPVHRDPAMFNAAEVENGPASREMSYKIQRWNVVSNMVHPILVANARVDWMALEDSELTDQLTILREGILRDVFSQRASAAWQGAQPQRLTVSLLLPGGGTAD